MEDKAGGGPSQLKGSEMLSVGERIGEVRRSIGRKACQLEINFRKSTASTSVHPDDEPRGLIEGPEPQSVVVLGDWNVAGVGVSTFDLSLSGYLARALAHRTGRGVRWQAVPVEGFRLAVVPETVAARIPSAIDIAVLHFGTLESRQFMAPEQWRSELTAAIDAVLPKLAGDGRILIFAVPPIDEIGSMTEFSIREIGREYRVLNETSREVVERYPQCLYCEYPEGLAAEVWNPTTLDLRYSLSNAVCGSAIAHTLARATQSV